MELSTSRPKGSRASGGAEEELERAWWDEAILGQVAQLKISFGEELERKADKIRSDMGVSQDRLDLQLERDRRERQASETNFRGELASQKASMRQLATALAGLQELCEQDCAHKNRICVMEASVEDLRREVLALQEARDECGQLAASLQGPLAKALAEAQAELRAVAERAEAQARASQDQQAVHQEVRSELRSLGEKAELQAWSSQEARAELKSLRERLAIEAQASQDGLATALSRAKADLERQVAAGLAEAPRAAEAQKLRDAAAGASREAGPRAAAAEAETAELHAALGAQAGRARELEARATAAQPEAVPSGEVEALAAERTATKKRVDAMSDQLKELEVLPPEVYLLSARLDEEFKAVARLEGAMSKRMDTLSAGFATERPYEVEALWQRVEALSSQLGQTGREDLEGLSLRVEEISAQQRFVIELLTRRQEDLKAGAAPHGLEAVARTLETTPARLEEPMVDWLADSLGSQPSPDWALREARPTPTVRPPGGREVASLDAADRPATASALLAALQAVQDLQQHNQSLRQENEKLEGEILATASEVPPTVEALAPVGAAAHMASGRRFPRPAVVLGIRQLPPAAPLAPAPTGAQSGGPITVAGGPRVLTVATAAAANALAAGHALVRAGVGQLDISATSSFPSGPCSLLPPPPRR